MVILPAGSSPLNLLSICAGVGGLELGLQLAHHHRGSAVRGVCYVEREAGAVASLVASMEAGWLHPAPVWSDARTFDGRQFRGCVDIVTSGDPCQGNSVAGKRRGELDDRWLLDRAIDIFDQSGADTFFRENVPGNADGQLAVAVPALERLGCRIAVGIFSSAETGNTMRRERLFILARRAGGGFGECGTPPWQGCVGHADGGCPRCGGAVARPERAEWGANSEPCGHQGPHGGAQRQEGAARPEPPSSGVACAASWRQQPRAEIPAGSELRLSGSGGDALAGVAVCELGGPRRAEPQGQQRGQHHAAGRQVQSRYPVLSGGAILPPAVIPGPADNRGWIDVLDRWPELQPALSEEEAQSHLRRGIDAMAHRVERLRATGNGVDPVVAAYAWLRLDALLRDPGAATGPVR